MTSIHSFNPDVIRRCQELAEPPRVIYGALDHKDITWILKKEQSLQEHYFVQKQNEVQNVNVDGVLWDFILSKSNIERKLYKTGGNFFKTVKPFLVHTDTPHVKDIVPYKNFLIPLTGGFGNCYTLFFKQRHWGVGAHFLRSEAYKDWYPDKNIKITDYSDVENYTGEDFPMQVFKEHLTHKPYENLHGLSLADIVKWNIGDIIIFDSTQLHCSNNFKKYERQEEKHALSLFSNLGDINESNT